jgi:hypothetical protein
VAFVPLLCVLVVVWPSHAFPVLHQRTPSPAVAAKHQAVLRRRRVVPTPSQREFLLQRAKCVLKRAGWEQWEDKVTRASFYFHPASGETQWDPPEALHVRFSGLWCWCWCCSVVCLHETRGE